MAWAAQHGFASGSTRRPVKGTATDHMKVEMKDGLASGCTVVNDQTIALQTFLRSDLVRDQKEMTQ